MGFKDWFTGDSKSGKAFSNIFAWPADVVWGGKDKDPILGGLYDDKYEDAMLDALKDAQATYADYRPEALEARNQGLQQTLGLFQPANNFLGEMYGPAAKVDFSKQQIPTNTLNVHPKGKK